MLKIGEFARLAQVSIKTLRHYGELGLLEPAWVDRFTSYRYYTLEQLPRLNRILALKDLGFSLEQIKALLRQDLPPAELRGMLRLRRAELQDEIRVEQARLARVESRLRQIEREGCLPAYAVVRKAVPAQTVVGLRARVASYRDVPHLLTELGQRLQRAGLASAVSHPWLALYEDRDEPLRGLEVEVAAPLAGKLTERQAEAQRLTLHNLPAVACMASAVHQGAYETLPEAYNALAAWTQTNGYHRAGASRELYLRSPAVDLAICVIEVQAPVESILEHLPPQQKESLMEPQIVTRPAFTVLGVLYHGKNEHQEIAALWERLGPRFPEFRHRVGGLAYGVCGHMQADGSFDYLAGVEVDHTDDLPAGMTTWAVPAQTYAVLPCTVATIHQTYEYALNTWLPNLSYRRASGPDLEVYGEDFDPETGAPMDVYIPITR